MRKYLLLYCILYLLLEIIYIVLMRGGIFYWFDLFFVVWPLVIFIPTIILMPFLILFLDRRLNLGISNVDLRTWKKLFVALVIFTIFGFIGVLIISSI